MPIPPIPDQSPKAKPLRLDVVLRFDDGTLVGRAAFRIMSDQITERGPIEVRNFQAMYFGNKQVNVEMFTTEIPTNVLSNDPGVSS